MTFSPGVPLASAWSAPAHPLPDTGLSVHDLVAHLEGKTGDLTAAVLSARIEAQLKQDGEKLKKEGSNVLKVLLLGQTGSGKSTTLKNFRMKYAREEWEQERLGWRAIIQLNIVRQALAIIQIVESEISGGGGHSDTIRGGEGGRATVGAVETWITGFGAAVETESVSMSPSQDETTPSPSLRFTEKHRRLITHLGLPLNKAEQELQGRLTPHEIYYPALATPIVSAATPFELGEKVVVADDDNDHDDILIRTKLVERSVRSWKDVLDAAPPKMALQQSCSSSASSRCILTSAADGKSTTITAASTVAGAVNSQVDIPTQVICDLKNDIKALWADGDVRNAVKRRRLDIPDSVGFDSDGGSVFLDEIDRIAQTSYEVTDYDIVRARLKTVGVQEYKFASDTGGPNIAGKKKWSWRIYDVGGCRTMRRAWLPYFDDVQAIIFLSPVSVFDERLEEDPRVNRLEDSIDLWSSICETPLLAKTQLILFLNKCDLLRKKLDTGVQVVHYLPSYGKRPNDPRNVVKYMRAKFKTIHREKSPGERALYIYPTTVTDMISTSVTLEAVRDNVVRRHIATSQLM